MFGSSHTEAIPVGLQQYPDCQELGVLLTVCQALCTVFSG